MNETTHSIWNPYRQGYRENPHEELRFFRRENPVHRGVNGYWLVFRFDDVRFVLTNPAFRTIKLGEHLRAKNRFLQPPDNLDALAGMIDKWLFLLDPPEHAELRGLVVRLWNRYQIQDFIRQTAAEAVARLAASDAPEALDDFAGYIPTRVISRILGLPFEDYERLRAWSHFFADTFEPFEPLPRLVRYNENARAVCAYMEGVMAAKKSRPDDSFIARLLAENDALARPCRHEELLSLVTMLFFAGMETSIYLLGQTVFELIRHPAEARLLREDESLLPRAVEELVRYISPLHYAPRVAAADVELRGRRIRAGELVLASIASANRDEEVFENPDALDFRRRAKAHVGFGHGFHHCIGARLARDELAAALPALLQRFARLEFDPARPFEWDRIVIFRRLKTLPVALAEAAPAGRSPH